jgi:UDP-N-acetylenolpyruvoylglucosamine reductase
MSIIEGKTTSYMKTPLLCDASIADRVDSKRQDSTEQNPGIFRQSQMESTEHGWAIEKAGQRGVERGGGRD